MLCWRRAKNSVGHGSEETGLSRIEIGYRALWEKGCYVNGRNKKKLLGRAGTVVKKCTYDVATCGLRRIWCQDILPVDISSPGHFTPRTFRPLEMWPPPLDISPLSGHFASPWTFRLWTFYLMGIWPSPDFSPPERFFPLTFYPLEISSPWSFLHAGFFASWTFRSMDNIPNGHFFPGHFAPRHFSPRTLRPLDIFSWTLCHWTFSPWTFSPLDI